MQNNIYVNTDYSHRPTLSPGMFRNKHGQLVGSSGFTIVDSTELPQGRQQVKVRVSKDKLEDKEVVFILVRR